jgi:hypothetical protein
MKTLLTILVVLIGFGATAQRRAKMNENLNHFLNIKELIDLKNTQDTLKLESLGFVNNQGTWSNDCTGEYITFTSDGMELAHTDEWVRWNDNRAINVDGIHIRRLNWSTNNYMDKTFIPGYGKRYITHYTRGNTEMLSYVNHETKLSILQFVNIPHKK